MKKILALLLALVLFLPVLSFAENTDEDYEDEDDEVEIEDLNEFYFSEEDTSALDSLLQESEVISSVKTDTLELNTNLPDNVINILLIGLDVHGTKEVQYLKDQLRLSNDSPNQSISKRSDVLMILSINTDTGSIKLTSIARNTYVELIKWSEKRQETYLTKSIIANAFGSAIYNSNNKYTGWIDHPDLCVRSVNHNFQLNIKYYVAINFFGVEEIIEALGGVDVDLTKEEANAINSYLNMKVVYLKDENGNYKTDSNGKRLRKYHGKEIADTYDNHSDSRVKLASKSGVQHLDGLQALIYARLRKIDNDFQRTARVRHLLDRLLKPTVQKIKSGELDFTNFAVTCTRYMYTNLPGSEIVSIAMNVLNSELMNSDLSSIDSLISEYRIPEDGQYSYQTVDGSSVTVMKDKQGTIERLHQFIYGEYYPPD